LGFGAGFGFGGGLVAPKKVVSLATAGFAVFVLVAWGLIIVLVTFNVVLAVLGFGPSGIGLGLRLLSTVFPGFGRGSVLVNLDVTPSKAMVEGFWRREVTFVVLPNTRLVTLPMRPRLMTVEGETLVVQVVGGTVALKVARVVR